MPVKESSPSSASTVLAEYAVAHLKTRRAPAAAASQEPLPGQCAADPARGAVA